MDKVVVKITKKYGKAVFAITNIKLDEVVAIFDGEIYEAQRTSQLPNAPPYFVRDHAIQFDEHKWRDSNSIARYIAHSCEPNCGIKDLFSIVAMRSIQAGEEITWDYDMTENSDWAMNCKCGSTMCRKIIQGYRYLPPEIRKKYNGYISGWLIQAQQRSL